MTDFYAFHMDDERPVAPKFTVAPDAYEIMNIPGDGQCIKYSLQLLLWWEEKFDEDLTECWMYFSKNFPDGLAEDELDDL